MGATAVSPYIASTTRDADDILNVLLLAREAGLVDLSNEVPMSRLDVVPLFETRDELSRAPSIMNCLFNDPVYARQLRARGLQQEVMLGYSDAAKEIGMVAASWEIYVAQERLAAVANEHGIGLTLFHGRGGAVGRGGGSSEFRALSALPPGTSGGGIKITEQGEVSWQKFGLLPLAERSLEVMLTGALVADTIDFRDGLDPQLVERFRNCMGEISNASRVAFTKMIHEDPALFQLFLTATPVCELSHLHRSSRPAHRQSDVGTLAHIPAIDWNFGWTQMRWMASAWAGAGTALSAVLAKNGGGDMLRGMAEKWPFFDELLNRVELAVVETDCEIARLAVNALGGSHRAMAVLEDEFERTRESLRQIRGRELMAGHRFLGASIWVRSPYGDALSIIQVSLLRKKRKLPEDHPDRRETEAAIRTTLIGLAQAMRSTG